MAILVGVLAMVVVVGWAALLVSGPSSQEGSAEPVDQAMFDHAAATLDEVDQALTRLQVFGTSTETSELIGCRFDSGQSIGGPYLDRRWRGPLDDGSTPTTSVLKAKLQGAGWVTGRKTDSAGRIEVSTTSGQEKVWGSIGPEEDGMGVHLYVNVAGLQPRPE